MSGKLDFIADGLTRRLKLRRQMFKHLGLRPPAPGTTEMRETIMACGKCPQPGICRGWMRHGYVGAPIFCKARSAFLRLGAANENVAPSH